MSHSNQPSMPTFLPLLYPCRKSFYPNACTIRKAVKVSCSKDCEVVGCFRCGSCCTSDSLPTQQRLLYPTPTMLLLLLIDTGGLYGPMPPWPPACHAVCLCWPKIRLLSFATHFFSSCFVIPAARRGKNV